MGKMKLKITDNYFDKKKKCWFITLEEISGLFGFTKKYVDYVESQFVFNKNKTLKVFYCYPEMKQLNFDDERTVFLTNCLRRIKFEETGEIIE